MKKTSNFLNEFLSGKKSYLANNLSRFNQKKDDVSHGKNGIEVIIEGNYRLDWTGKKRTSLDYESYKNPFGEEEIIVTRGDLDNNGTLSSFPHSKETKVLIHLHLLMENFLDFYQEKEFIYLLNPLVFYEPKLLEDPIIISGTETLPKKGKKIPDLKSILSA